MAARLSFLRPVGALLDRLFCVAVAALFVQAPVYIQQYVDVLTAAHQTSGQTYDTLTGAADRFNMPLDEYLAQLRSNPDRLVREQAETDQTTVHRHARYTEALTALTRGPRWLRPVYILWYFDWSLHAALTFEPGHPFSWEGLAYATAGTLTALLILYLLGRLGDRLSGRSSGRP
ncbi:MAG: DUF2937 family protein [Bacteroidia bacterium]|nr:DUF2937 family protein [Bacteroidia bacterium]